jgi:hypothetical protein
MVVFTIGMPSMIQGQFAHQDGTCHQIRSGQVWYLSGAALQYQETPSSQRMVGLIRGMEPISVDSQECREVKGKTILVITRLQDKEVLGGPPLLMLICLAIESLDSTVVEWVVFTAVEKSDIQLDASLIDQISRLASPLCNVYALKRWHIRNILCLTF